VSLKKADRVGYKEAGGHIGLSNQWWVYWMLKKILLERINDIVVEENY
jgi:hypothetical protein